VRGTPESVIEQVRGALGLPAPAHAGVPGVPARP
jgi:hypothetical protein